VAEVRAAKGNVASALAGDPNIPSPPAEGQDHVARLEVYSTVQQLIQSLGDTVANKILTAVMQAHQMLLQAEMDKEAKPGSSPKLNKPMGVK
jgi:hypothetical protein